MRNFFGTIKRVITVIIIISLSTPHASSMQIPKKIHVALLFFLSAFIGEALNDATQHPALSRSALPVCHLKPDGTTQCCGVLVTSPEITCCRFDDTDNPATPLLCGFINPEALSRKEEAYYDNAHTIIAFANQPLSSPIKYQPNYFTDPLCNLKKKKKCPPRSSLFTSGAHFTVQGQTVSKVPLNVVIDPKPIAKDLDYLKQTLWAYAHKNVSFFIEIAKATTDFTDTRTQVNADGTVREYDVVMATELLLKIYSYKDLEGIFSHECGHMIIFGTPGSTNYVTHVEDHERTADLYSGLFTEHPEWLASALYRMNIGVAVSNPDYFDETTPINAAMCRRGVTIRQSPSTGGGYPPTICRIKELQILGDQYNQLTDALSEDIKNMNISN